MALLGPDEGNPQSKALRNVTRHLQLNLLRDKRDRGGLWGALEKKPNVPLRVWETL